MMKFKKILLVSSSCVSLLAAQDISAATLSFDFSTYGGSERFLSGKSFSFSDIHLYTHSSIFSESSPQSSPTKLASVCFITDAGECSGAGAGRDEPSSSGPGPIEPDGPERCRLEGYTDEVCQEGFKPGLDCPYDPDWHTGCVKACPVENTETCTAPDEQGVGEACDGLYASCCRLCTDFPYDEIKDGYEAKESCTDCDGKTHYKLQCDVGIPGSSGGTYVDCGENDGVSSSGVCTDPETGEPYYKECKCPLNYEWSDTTKECVCATSFKYSCSGTGYDKGEGESCDNKYQKCSCAKDYQWSESGGCVKCDTSFQYTCSGENMTGGSGDGCGGKYQSCTCADGYTWNNGECVMSCNVGDLYCHRLVLKQGIYEPQEICTKQRSDCDYVLGFVIYVSPSGGGAVMSLKKLTGASPNLDVSGLHKYTSEFTAAKDFDFCQNTNIIRNTFDSSVYSIAWDAFNYNPSGMLIDREWCLPSAGLLYSLDQNYNSINSALSRSLGTDAEIARDEEIPSSTLSSSSNAYGDEKRYITLRFQASNGGFGIDSRSALGTFRPVLYFGSKCNSSYINTCIGTGYLGGIGEHCFGKYQKCSCAEGWTWNGRVCESSKKDICQLGWLYYSDGTCSEKKLSNKTLLGVVIYVKGDGSGIIMSHDNIAARTPWSTRLEDNRELENFGTATDWNSCENTEKLIKIGNPNDYEAVWAAYNYRPQGTPAGKNWCLPAIGVLASMPNNFDVINSGFKTAGGSIMGFADNSGGDFTTGTYWSSTEASAGYAWILRSDGGTQTWQKDYEPERWYFRKQSVRPVLEFEEGKPVNS